MAEDPTEQAQEDIHHHATHGHGEHGGGPRWITVAACTAAIIAVLAALSGSQATAHLNRSMHYQMMENDQWSYYQAKSLKNYVLESESSIIAQLSHEPAPKNVEAKIAKNDQDKAKIQADAKEFEHLANEHMETHETFETSTTLFHIAIAVLAISVVAKRKEFWWLSMIGGAVGIYFFCAAYGKAPVDPAEKKENAASGTTASAQAAPAEPAAH